MPGRVNGATEASTSSSLPSLAAASKAGAFSSIEDVGSGTGIWVLRSSVTWSIDALIRFFGSSRSVRNKVWPDSKVTTSSSDGSWAVVKRWDCISKSLLMKQLTCGLSPLHSGLSLLLPTGLPAASAPESSRLPGVFGVMVVDTRSSGSTLPFGTT